MTTQSQPPAAGEAAHDPRLTPVPPGPFSVAPTGCFGAGWWETAVRGSNGNRLCTVVEREYMPQESGRVRASFIASACSAHEALVSAAEAFLFWERQRETDDLGPIADKFRAALALAKGGAK